MLLVVWLPPGCVGDASDEWSAAVAVARAHREDLRARARDGRLEAAGQLLSAGGKYEHMNSDRTGWVRTRVGLTWF